MASAQITQTKGPTGNLVFQNQTGDTVFNISQEGGLPGFFAQGECQSDEAIKTINPDGTYECNSISTTTQAENLSETLAAGNVADQNIGLDPDLSDNSANSIVGVNEIVLSGDQGNERTIRPEARFGDLSIRIEGARNQLGSGGDAVIVGGASSDDSQYDDGNVILGSKNTERIGLGTSSPDTFVDIEGGKLDLSSNNITGISNLEGFFDQDKCDSDEAIKTVYPNGSYACNQLSTTTQAENLSETLAAGNVANQSIELGGNEIKDVSALRTPAEIVIGSGAEAVDNTNDRDVVVGQGATISSFGTIPDDFDAGMTAIGPSANTLSVLGKYSAVAVGYNAQADGDSVALGPNSDTAVSLNSVSLGPDTTTEQDGAVAIGDSTTAVNRYEATFGNLNGQELDLNVTGNATIHGSGGLNMPNGVVIGDASLSGDSSKTGSIAIGQGASAEDNDAIAIGDGATASSGNFELALGRKASAKKTNSVALGPDATSSGVFSSTLGANAKASAQGSVAIGGGSTAGGAGPPSASNTGSVAIGAGSVSDQEYTVELGSDSQSYDLIVNGNATAEDFISSGADLAEVYSAERDYEPGTVVSVSSGGSDVESASRFEDVAGVVSTDPGFTLNSGEEGVEVALEGRVPVKVSEKVEKGEDLAAGPDGRAVACETGQVEELSSDASKSKIVEAVNSLNSNQECLKASFGEALKDSENGKVEVMLD